MLGSPAGGRIRDNSYKVLGKLDMELGVNILFFKVEVDERTTWRWRSFSVLWLYQGSSRSGDHCQAYFRTVLITALLIKMQRYTIRKAFIDLQRESVKVRRRKWGVYLILEKYWQTLNYAVKGEGLLIILFYSRALLRFRLVIKCHLGLHASIDRNSWGERKHWVTNTIKALLCSNICQTWQHSADIKQNELIP